MKKFLIPVFALAFTSAAFASEATSTPVSVDPVVVAPATTSVVAPVVAASNVVSTSATSTNPAGDAKKVEAGFFSKWVTTPAKDLEKYLNATIVAHPWKSVGVTVVLTIAAMKAIEYAQNANSDEDDQF